MNIGMRLELRQTFALEIVQRHELQGHADSVVPRTTEALESGEHDDVLRMIRDLDVTGVAVQWRSVTDWFLAVVVPSEREHVLRYYAGDGPRLKDIYDAALLRRLDTFLLRQLGAMEAGLELEREMRRYAEGGR